MALPSEPANKSISSGNAGRNLWMAACLTSTAAFGSRKHPLAQQGRSRHPGGSTQVRNARARSAAAVVQACDQPGGAADPESGVGALKGRAEVLTAEPDLGQLRWESPM